MTLHAIAMSNAMVWFAELFILIVANRAGRIEPEAIDPVQLELIGPVRAPVAGSVEVEGAPSKLAHRTAGVPAHLGTPGSVRVLERTDDLAHFEGADRPG